MSLFHSHMRFYVTQWSVKKLCGGLSVHSQPLPSQKKIVPLQPTKIRLSAILVYTNFGFEKVLHFVIEND